MNKIVITILALSTPAQVFAAQQQLQLRSNTTSPSVDTNFVRQQSMNTDLYTNKADKSALGTAAALNAGTAPGNLVPLDSEGKLPAIDASRVTGITGTLPNGSTTGQTVEWDATNNVWTPIDWNTLSADGNSLTISSGVLSVAGASSSANGSVLGRNSHGVFGFNPISDYVSTSGLLPITQEADPTASDADGIYVATVSGKVFIKSATGLVSWSATITPWDTTPDQWTFTAQTGLQVSTDVLSNSVTVAGLNSTAPISASGDAGCGYSKNSGSCASADGTIINGDTLKACVTTSASALTETTCTLSSTGMFAEFSATTGEVATSWVIEDNFSANTLANYTKISGTGSMGIAEGIAYNAGNVGSTAWMMHSTDLGSANQVVQAVISDRVGSTSGASSGILLRTNGTTGHGMWVDIGEATHRFVFEALGGSGTTSYKSYVAGKWAADSAHLVQVTVKADNTYCVEADFNDDLDFLDADENVGCTSANASYTGTKVGVGWRSSNDKVDSFKAKAYIP